MTDKQQLALLRSCEKHLKLTRKGWLEKPVGSGTEWKRAMEALHKVQKSLVSTQPWVNVGPVTKQGASVLDFSPTHNTDGIPLFPAFDTAWGAGVPIYAPEACVVDTHDTSANPGNAVFITGASGLRYWIGHIDRDWPLGKKFTKGSIIGKTVNQPPGKTDHCHVGVNAEKFLGAGKQLKYGRTGNGPDYTTGSPRIRLQLREVEL